MNKSFSCKGELGGQSKLGITKNSKLKKHEYTFSSKNVCTSFQALSKEVKVTLMTFEEKFLF